MGEAPKHMMKSSSGRPAPSATRSTSIVTVSLISNAGSEPLRQQRADKSNA
jgi:hypothetical protein